jgi:hypothetical protein
MGFSTKLLLMDALAFEIFLFTLSKMGMKIQAARNLRSVRG